MSDESKGMIEESDVMHAGSIAAAVSSEPVETLVVVSKVKGFIRSKSELNTSQDAIDALSQKIAEECIKGIERAKAAGRKTVMGRDLI